MNLHYAFLSPIHLASRPIMSFIFDNCALQTWQHRQSINRNNKIDRNAVNGLDTNVNKPILKRKKT